MSAVTELTKAEQETILLTSEADSTVNVYTFNQRLKERLREYSLDYPGLCRLLREQENGSVTYEVEKSRLSIRLLPPPTANQRRAGRATIHLARSAAGQNPF